MILINFKTYRETWGEKGVELAKLAKGKAIVTASALEATTLLRTGVEVWLQHVDWQSEGRGSGKISMSQALSLGIKGSLLNHSEYPLSKGTILKTLAARPSGFEIMVCAKSLGQIEWIARANPNWILYEPPELIASKDSSVADHPQTIKKAVSLAREIPLLVGAGIKSRMDAEISRKMGAKGIGLSSALVLAEDPGKVIEELILGINATI